MVIQKCRATSSSGSIGLPHIECSNRPNLAQLGCGPSQCWADRYSPRSWSVPNTGLISLFLIAPSLISAFLEPAGAGPGAGRRACNRWTGHRPASYGRTSPLNAWEPAPTPYRYSHRNHPSHALAISHELHKHFGPREGEYRIWRK